MSCTKSASVVVACWLLGSVSSVFANTALSESAHVDWAGVVSRSELRDGSVLFEYTSRTFSARTEGAMFALTFIPRFQCSASIGLRVRAGTFPETQAPRLQLTLSNRTSTFDALVDKDQDYVLYTLIGPTERLEQLRQELDKSLRVVVSVVPADYFMVGGASGAAQAKAINSSQGELDGVEFSLLGSRMSMSAVESHCEYHQPLDYRPRPQP